MNIPLDRHQIEALDYTMRTRASALYMEMRLRKTPVVINSVIQKNAFPCLVVMPYSAFAGWRYFLKMAQQEYIEVVGSRSQRLKLLVQPSKFYLVNKEIYLVVPELFTKCFESVVLDEATFINNPKTKVSSYYIKHFNTLVKYLLTGTTLEDIDLINHFRFLELTELSYYEFRNKFFIEYEPHKFSLNRFKSGEFQRLKHGCFFQRRAEAGFAKDKTYMIREIPRPKKDFNDIYKLLDKKFRIEYQTTKCSTVFACEKFLWMRRLCSGMVEGKLAFRSKLNELIYLIGTELRGESILICAQYRDEIEEIKKAVQCEVIHGDIPIKERDEIVRRFQVKETKIILFQPMTMKFGKDLSKANTLIFYSTPVGEAREQAEARLIDLDKNEPLLYIDLVISDTIEEDIVQGIYNGWSLERISKKCLQ